MGHPDTGSMVQEQTPKRDHHGRGVTTDQAVTPRTTLLIGHSGTSVATASASGCPSASYARCEEAATPSERHTVSGLMRRDGVTCAATQDQSFFASLGAGLRRIRVVSYRCCSWVSR